MLRDFGATTAKEEPLAPPLRLWTTLLKKCGSDFRLGLCQPAHLGFAKIFLCPCRNLLKNRDCVCRGSLAPGSLIPSCPFQGTCLHRPIRAMC